MDKEGGVEYKVAAQEVGQGSEGAQAAEGHPIERLTRLTGH